MVIRLAQDINNQILVTGRNEKALNSLSARYKNVRSLTLDMALFDGQQEKFRETVSNHFRSVDILINIAGAIIVKEFLKMTNDEARIMMETNFFGPATLIRVLQPFMPSGSHIVNISSMGGFQGSTKYTDSHIIVPPKPH